ncbi:DUF397 domain-containing protein [Streptomyces griseoviridis]|uniref:DUF397 domain-containing protein n=1 Tax=Streptomyces griseoviridis TaxID=45398 RepID=A0A918G7P0_STRGD|nr:DUF397 domain-containing protein [Streptomyces niveoruber]GGS23569.1 hypothetical protein GCM10010238_09520 [Streptomyces niveoruber]
MTDLAWFKSSYSGGNDGESCVEVAITPRSVHARDSRYGTGGSPRLMLGAGSWGPFLSSLRCAEVAVGQGELSVNSVATLFESFAPGRSQRFR